MWQQLWVFLQTQQGIGVAGLVAIVLYLLYANGKFNSLSQYFPKWLGGTGGEVNDTYDRGTVWDNLQYNYEYFKSIGCSEGMKLTEQTSQHVFHEADPVDATTPNVTAVIQAIGDALNKSAESPPITAPQETASKL